MRSTYMFRNLNNFLIISTHNTFFQTRNHLEQLLKYAMLPPLSRTTSDMVKFSSSSCSYVLDTERLLRFFRQFAQAQDAIRNQNFDVGKGMGCATEMPTVGDKWVGCSARSIMAMSYNKWQA